MPRCRCSTAARSPGPPDQSSGLGFAAGGVRVPASSPGSSMRRGIDVSHRALELAHARPELLRDVGHALRAEEQHEQRRAGSGAPRGRRRRACAQCTRVRAGRTAGSPGRGIARIVTSRRRCTEAHADPEAQRSNAAVRRAPHVLHAGGGAGVPSAGRVRVLARSGTTSRSTRTGSRAAAGRHSACRTSPHSARASTAASGPTSSSDTSRASRRPPAAWASSRRKRSRRGSISGSSTQPRSREPGYARQVVPGLLEVLAVDLPESVVTLSKDDLSGLGSLAELLERGRANLRALVAGDVSLGAGRRTAAGRSPRSPIARSSRRASRSSSRRPWSESRASATRDAGSSWPFPIGTSCCTA